MITPEVKYIKELLKDFPVTVRFKRGNWRSRSYRKTINRVEIYTTGGVYLFGEDCADRYNSRLGSFERMLPDHCLMRLDRQKLRQFLAEQEQAAA